MIVQVKLIWNVNKLNVHMKLKKMSKASTTITKNNVIEII